MFTGMPLSQPDGSLFKKRTQELIRLVKKEHAETDCGMILLFANLMSDTPEFRQESSFYYETGLHEAGVVLALDFSGKSCLYVPRFSQAAAQWRKSGLSLDDAKRHGVDEIKYLGEEVSGYQLSPHEPDVAFKNLIDAMRVIVDNQGVLVTLLPSKEGSDAYIFGGQVYLLERLLQAIPGSRERLHDLYPFIAEQRVLKDMHEIELLYKAIDITSMGHEAATRAIANGVLEAEVQASIEYVFTVSGAAPAFSSIVGSGINSTVLHYDDNADSLQSGDLVVVDIGARSGGYAADITRTYPVSGIFTKRQKEVYDIVLAAQDYIADIARPGYWLNNADKPEKSLHHLAKKFFEERGYGDYFTHGVGHYLGLDVHDVGSYKQPLQEGMVITIEPGLYIPNERIGIRIEDDYWLVKEGAVCLSEQLPKKAAEIEKMMQVAHQGDAEIEPLFDDEQVGQS